MGTLVFPLIRQQQYAMVVAPPIFSLLSIIAVALRFTARRLAHRRPDSSDYTLLVALFMSVAYSGLNMAECLTGGGGLHVTEIFALGGSMVAFQKVSVHHCTSVGQVASVPLCSLIVLHRWVSPSKSYGQLL